MRAWRASDAHCAQPARTRQRPTNSDHHRSVRGGGLCDASAAVRKRAMPYGAVADGLDQSSLERAAAGAAVEPGYLRSNSDAADDYLDADAHRCDVSGTLS